MKNANIMGVHKKNSIYGELPKRGGGGAWKFSVGVDTSMRTDLILVHDRK